MGDTRSVSIVILTHNNLAYTEACIARLEETTDAYELVIVDNASSDGTPAYLTALEERRKNVRVLLNPANRGFAGGCNQGVGSARFGTICLLNNDTLPFPGWLDALRDALEPGVGAVGSKLVLPDYTLQHCGIEFVHREEPQPHFWPHHRYLGYPEEIEEASRLEEVPGVTAASLLTTKTVWNRVGGMDEGYRVANFEDVDFNLAIRKSGLKVLYQPTSRLVHFWGKTVSLKSDSAESASRFFAQNFSRLMTKWYAPLQQGLARV